MSERSAFIVVVTHPHGRAPVIGDIHWALLEQQEHRAPWGHDWDIHTTVLTPEMLAHHGLPEGGLSNEPTLAEGHQAHYQSCNCLGDSAECCVPGCACHEGCVSDE